MCLFFHSTAESHCRVRCREAVFAVMCPHTEYWQTTIAQTVGALVAELGVDAVYIDQIAAAGPEPCWDPTHNHSLGGGDHWVSGYGAMLRAARGAAVAARGARESESENDSRSTVLLTESNAEPFLSGIDIYLTLVGPWSSRVRGATRGVEAH